MNKIVLTEALENQIKDLNENQYLYRMKTKHLNDIFDNELIYNFDTHFDYIRLIYTALDCVYYDTFFDSIDYDECSLKRLAKSFAFEIINTTHYVIELKEAVNKLLEAQESLDTKLSRISRNKLDQYFKDTEERMYVEDLIDITRFALYSLFSKIIEIVSLKKLQYEYEEQLISDDLNE